MTVEDRAAALYIDLLKRVLTRYGFSEGVLREATFDRVKWLRPVQNMLRRRRLYLARPEPFDPHAREYGRDMPAYGETMVGLRRLDNLHMAIRAIIADSVPGDIVEAGVWRGGASIFMKGVLTAYGDTRDLWLADSFQGLPAPGPDYPADSTATFHLRSFLAISEDTVRGNFARYGLLDEHVHFVKGWFRDTLTRLPAERISLLRLDGDMYESTIQTLEPLYPKLSPGGFCVIDDYALDPCRQAVHEYRRDLGISEPLIDIDGTAAYWRKSAD